MIKGSLFFLLTLIGGTGLSFLAGGIPLALIYFVLWFDKAIIGIVSGVVRKFGVELVSISAVPLGILYGPILAALFLIIVLPIVHAVKYILFDRPSEWPLFLPSPWNIGHAIGGFAAGLLAGFDPFIILIAVLIIQDLYFFAYEAIAQKPMDFIGASTNLVFNIIIYPAIAVPMFLAVGIL